MGKRFVILGNGIAGYSAAAEIRRQSREAEITLISEEESAIIRPRLSKICLQSFQRENIRLGDDSWYEKQGIRQVLGRRVEEILPKENRICLSDGSSYLYDTGIYALGARCFVPPFPGTDKRGVATVRTAEDIARIRRLTATAACGAVIGGGVIGMEMAWELHQAGCPVTILEAGPRLMGRLLDEESAGVLCKKAEAQGIPVCCGVNIQELTGEGRVTGVKLEDGRWFPADLVIISCGIRANTELAEQAGILCGQGVLVDDFLQTSHPDFLAAGDCIQWKKPNPGLWNYARKSGTLAGYYGVKREERDFLQKQSGFSPSAEPVIFDCMGTSLFSIGSTEEGEGIETYREGQILGKSRTKRGRFLVNHHEGENEPYRKFFVKDGLLSGAVLIGDLSGLAEIKEGIGAPFGK